MPVRLHVNVDHVATVRNARGTHYPDPVFAAQLCEAAGADGITAHLREDRRHIRDDDIERLRATIGTVLNLECAATEEMIDIACRVLPDVITLVPERREERTTEGGLDVVGQAESLRGAIARAKNKGIIVSLFVAPKIADIEMSHELGADEVELHTGEFSHHSLHSSAAAEELARLRSAAGRAEQLGLVVAAGHGLTRHNTPPIIAIEQVAEVNTGHAIIADAVFMGLEKAIVQYRAAIERGIRMRGR